jgi:hypothetical protein
MFTTYTVADFRPQSAKGLHALPSPTAAPFAATPTGTGSLEPAAHVAPAAPLTPSKPSASPKPPAPAETTPVATTVGKTGWKSTKLGSVVPFAPLPPNTEPYAKPATEQPSGLGTAPPSGLQRLPIDAAGVQAILVPEEWEQHKSNLPPGYGSIQTIGPTSKKLTISVADRGQPLSQSGLRNFMNVLATADGATKSRPLLPSQIKSLSELFGKASIGDNQHTNTNRWMPYTFKMFSASAFIVNGRPVIEVEGQFVDANGQRIRDHIGLYTMQRNKVSRIFLDATSKDDYIYGRWLYKYLLKTIEWS